MPVIPPIPRALKGASDAIAVDFPLPKLLTQLMEYNDTARDQIWKTLDEWATQRPDCECRVIRDGGSGGSSTPRSPCAAQLVPTH